ncbi:MAG TPA: 6,7-dimethyl-8-ribityllumazine synthase [Verrucomicrobiae bacterium]|jgi:6,7-dimethyl-8-ribityllumazine synthase|nr:6,7-dimethyl-8-ribityllumazine synthase [Verrucomicrobiae bacterium]
MIKAITTVRLVRGPKEFKALAELLDSLGLERGKNWKTRRGQGLPFHAPLGKVEIIEGKVPLPADLWVEVTDLDSIRDLLKKQRIKFVSDVAATGWNSRLLVIEPVKNLRLAFWQKDRPEKDAIEGGLNAAGMRLAIVVARWNSFITERLLQGALDALRRSGCRGEDITVVRVPGSFEIPSQARTLAETGTYDAIITLGCLIRGDTTHYEHIATEVTRGIGQSAQETGVPHTYGVLTCENLEQALDRAGLKAGNKGFEAAMSAVEMVSLKRLTQSKKPRARTPAPSKVR